MISLGFKITQQQLLKTSYQRSICRRFLSDAKVNKHLDEINLVTNELVAMKNNKVSNITVEKTAKNLCQLYSQLSKEDSDMFLTSLATGHQLDLNEIQNVGRRLVENAHPSILSKLVQETREKLQPPGNFIFSKVGQLQGGVKFLVDMRRDLLQLLKQLDFKDESTPALQSMNKHLQLILSNWFSVGFLEVEQLTWDSPSSMLEKVSNYEAVHPVRNWTDLKSRVGPYRRCFVYTHPSMPREPVVVLHVALTPSIPATINSIVKQHRSIKQLSGTTTWMELPGAEDPEDCLAAIFYSITSTQPGLQGIEQGSHLIKQAVVKLQKEFPGINTFSTLSPIPGFRSWLLVELSRAARGETKALLDDEIQQLLPLVDADNVNKAVIEHVRAMTWLQDDRLLPVFQRMLTRLCARYLYTEKRRSYALDSVANFHLRNGAVLWRVNWLADTSVRGMTNSCGMMVNYRYFLHDLEDNSNRYLQEHVIPVHSQVSEQL